MSTEICCHGCSYEFSELELKEGENLPVLYCIDCLEQYIDEEKPDSLKEYIEALETEYGVCLLVINTTPSASYKRYLISCLPSDEQMMALDL